MPISKFAVKIAHTLADYLDYNSAKLPLGYRYGVDNSAVLSPYTASNISHKAVGLAASAARGAVSQTMYTLGFWAKEPSPSPLSCKTPVTSSYLSIPGIEGVDRAIQIATHFGLLEDEGRGTTLVETLKTEGEGRRSILINEQGFNVIDPNNILENEITRADCDRILSFVTHKNRWHECTSGRKIINALREYFRVDEDQVANEKRILENMYIEVSANKNGEEDFVHLAKQTNRAESPAPAILCRPDAAALKLIFEKVYALKGKLANETIISTSLPPGYMSQSASHYSRRSSLRSPNSAVNTSAASSSSSSSTSASRSHRSNSSDSGTMFPFS